MTTLREFILAGSSLSTGNTVRDHLNNQLIGGGGGAGIPFPIDNRTVDIHNDHVVGVDFNTLVTSVDVHTVDITSVDISVTSDNNTKVNI